MSIHRSLRNGAAAVAVCTSLAVVVPAVATAATPAPAMRTMLVLLRPGHATAGISSAHASLAGQASVARLAQREGIAVLGRTSVPGTLTLRLTAPQAAALAADPLVASVLPDVAIPGPTSPTIALGRDVPGSHTTSKTAASCGTFRHPQLDPEALTNINDVPGDHGGFDGKGVKVAFLADGIDTRTPTSSATPPSPPPASPAGSPVITEYQDFSGDGTAAPTQGGEAFLDAGSIAAQGNTDLRPLARREPRAPAAGWLRHPDRRAPRPVRRRSRSRSSRDNTTTSSGFVQAINYAVAHGAKVINESFGANGFPDTAIDIVRAADDAAVAAGVTVVVSSGDAGIT